MWQLKASAAASLTHFERALAAAFWLSPDLPAFAALVSIMLRAIALAVVSRTALVSAQPAVELHTQTSLKLNLPDGQKFLLDPFWLRERSQEAGAVDQITLQPLLNPHELPAEMSFKNVSYSESNNTIKVAFTDGHTSQYKLEKLVGELTNFRQHAVQPTSYHKPAVRTWSGDHKLAVFDYSAVANQEASKLALIEALLTSGTALIRKAPRESGTVINFARMISTLRETEWGPWFNVRTKPDVSQAGGSVKRDLAYTPRAIGFHTDNPYRSPTPDFQLLHAVEHCFCKDKVPCPECSVINYLVDGFHIAELLKKESPEDFDMLRILFDGIALATAFRSTKPQPCLQQDSGQIPVRFENNGGDGTSALIHITPHLELEHPSPSGETALKSVAFSAKSGQYAPALEPTVAAKFYKARRRFSEMMHEPRFAVSMQFQPGDILVFDNRRVLHARSHILPTDGERWVQGCYIDRDGLIHNHGQRQGSYRKQSGKFQLRTSLQLNCACGVSPLNLLSASSVVEALQRPTAMSLTSHAFVVPKSAPGMATAASLRAAPQHTAAHGDSLPRGLQTSAVLLAAAALRRAHRGACGASVARHAEKGATVVGVESEDAEALAKEAAKLRAEAAELEAEQEELRRKERQALFKILDTDSSGALDAKELQKGVKDVMGSDVTDEQAERLVTALDLNGDGIIQPEELDFTAVQTLLREFRKEMQTKEEAERTAAYASTEEELLRKEWDEFLANRPARNEDTGLLTRIGSLLAYALPLTDALRFGMFLFAAFPEIQPLLDFLVVPVVLVNALPFGLGYLILFLSMQALATNRDLPALLRYNLRQAITLDIFLVFMSLVGGLIQGSAVLFNTPLPLEVIGLASTAIYFAVTGACIYSIVISLTGKFPKGLGPITELAEFQIFDTAPSDGDEDTAKYFDQIFKNRPKDEEEK
eukprot:s211_g23.t3